MKAFDEIYRLLEEKTIGEWDSESRIYEHIKTGARIMTCKNEDKNKVFMIGFRTPPTDSTGVPHIMEHSVLCGSEKYPIKDPFVELAKGSLNTFLNAMTYPDKTVYPVASQNDKDFMNLMDVYLDAVFHPNIYKEKKIFLQEGWHYELREGEPLRYNGVVYNEMKGAFSNPESVLERATMHALFPHTAYGVESGGEPEHIPDLSYEEFLKFHKTYYHPSNSYLYLYGDMDMEEKLRYIDANYFSAYDRCEITSDIKKEASFGEMAREEMYYPIGDNESLSHHTYLSENYVFPEGDVMGDTLGEDFGQLSSVRSLAWQVLEFVLLDMPGAPLKEALVKAGIGEDIFGGFTTGILQPYFSVVAKNAEKEDEERFAKIINDSLETLVRDGLDREALRGAISNLEFHKREADFGRMPKGLMLGLSALDSWLYGVSPFRFLGYEREFAFLKEHIEQGYFEALIKICLLENSHRARVLVLPKQGLTKEREEALSRKLQAYQNSLSDAEKEALIKETKALSAYQEAEDREEDIAKLPVLSVSDISHEILPLKAKQTGKLLYSEMDTHGIAYAGIFFDASPLCEEELQFASFLTELYGEMDTARHSYRELSNEMLLHIGAMDMNLTSFPKYPDGVFTVKLRVLREELPFAFSFVSELLLETLFADEDRIGEKLLETRSRVQMKIDGASHSAAVCRAGSYFSATARFDDLTDGIAYYDFLNASAKFYQEPVHRKRWLKSLKKVAEKLFVKKQVFFTLSGGKEEKQLMKAAMQDFTNALPKAKAVRGAKGKAAEAKREQTAAMAAAGKTALTASVSLEQGALTGGMTELPSKNIHVQGRLNEGFKTGSQVNYVARSGSFKDAGLPYTGALNVLKVLLNYDYLWLNLRVKGGAYGCMSGFTRAGRSFLVSYRDPELAKTNEIYKALPDYLENLSLSGSELNKYIIGAISAMDQPQTLSMLAAREIAAYYAGVTEADLRREREEVLCCDEQALRALAPYMKAILDAEYICTIGNTEKIKEDETLFNSIRELY